MDKKFWINFIIGSIAFFFLGWLIYGMLLADVMDGMIPENLGECKDMLYRADEDMNYGALIGFNLAQGFFLAWLIGLAGSNNFMSGAKIGLITGFLLTAWSWLMQMAFTYMAGTSVFITDLIVGSLLWAFVAGIMGYMRGR